MFFERAQPKLKSTKRAHVGRYTEFLPKIYIRSVLAYRKGGIIHTSLAGLNISGPVAQPKT